MFLIFSLLFASLVYNSPFQPLQSSHVVSNDVGTFLTTVKVHTGSASVNAEVVATYSAGETVVYDEVLANESRTWISYVGGSGRRNYCCAVDIGGERYISGPPDLIGNGSSGSGSWKTDDWAFLELPINYSFGISDSKLLAAFKNSGSRIISKHGFTDQDILDTITTVRRIGVAPEWFLAYAVEEGAVYGWINHFSSNTGTAAAMAQKDSDWIVSQSQKAASCAWYDVGNPNTAGGKSTFVPADIQKAGNAKAATLPTGSIGRVYLAGTAAATWAVFYPEGLLGKNNGVQDYGNPIKGCRQLISSWL